MTETDTSHAKIERRTLEKKAEESAPSADETEPEDGMSFIRRSDVESSQIAKRNAHGGLVVKCVFASDVIYFRNYCLL